MFKEISPPENKTICLVKMNHVDKFFILKRVFSLEKMHENQLYYVPNHKGYTRYDYHLIVVENGRYYYTDLEIVKLRAKELQFTKNFDILKKNGLTAKQTIEVIFL